MMELATSDEIGAGLDCLRGIMTDMWPKISTDSTLKSLNDNVADTVLI